MTINNFMGGLSTRLAPHLIDINQATLCRNVDMTDGTLKPLKGLKARVNTIPLNNNHFTVFNGAFISGTNGVHFSEFDDKLYKSITDGVISKTSDGINWVELGIDAPTTKVTVSTPLVAIPSNPISTGASTDIPSGTYNYVLVYKTMLEKYFKQEVKVVYNTTRGIKFTSDTEVVSTYKVFRQYNGAYYLVGESDSSGVVNDTLYNISNKELYSSYTYQSTADVRNYVYTYYSTTTFIESAPSPISEDLEVEILQASIYGFLPTTDITVDSIRIYRIGGTLNNFYLVDTISIVGIATKTYVDTKSDLQVLEGTLLETTDLIKPPIGLKFLTEWNSTLWAVENSKLWFSEQGLVSNWRANNWIQFPENITGLGATQNGLLVFSRNRTWIISGDNVSSYFKYLLNGSQGCITHNTISYIDNNLIWLSLDGICTSNGSSITIASYNKLGKLNLEPIKAEVYDSQYFLFTDTDCIVADFRDYNSIGLRFFNIDINARGAYYSPYYDTFYILPKDSIGVHEYDKGELLEFHYRTGYIVNQGKTNYKLAKNFYIYSVGENTVNIFIDNVNILEDYLLTNGLNEIKTRGNDSNGYFLEIELKGTGSISEIEFSTIPRQTGD